MKTITNGRLDGQQPLQNDSRQFTRQGWQMAQQEGHASLESIEILHEAEVQTVGPCGTLIQARGSVILVHRNALDAKLRELGYNVAQHLHELARGSLDLAWGAGLFLLNGCLAVLVLLEFGPNWLAILLALVVLASALPVEEFFQAHEERASLREGIFLALSILAIAAQVWLGCVRGMLLGAVAADGAGPASEALATGGSIVRYALGMLAAVSEVMCGWKLHRARTALLSPIARAVCERDHMNAQLTQLSGALHANSAGPEIRRHYRRVGARQQLAWAAGAAERARATHLKRAFKGALIALVILALLFLLASRLSAGTNGHSVAVLVDLSKSVTSEDFKANINGVSEVLGKLQPSERVIILGITDKFGHPAILLDKSMPDDSGFLRLKQQAARETIMAAWMNAAKNLKPTFGHTDVLGTLAILPYLGNFTISGAQIVIFSDLQHSMKDLDFEHLKAIPADKIIGQLKRAKTMPALKGAIVFVLGADPNGKSASDYASLRDFWCKFFHENGAELRVFSIDRYIPDLNHIQQRST